MLAGVSFVALPCASGCAAQRPQYWATWEQIASLETAAVARVVLGLSPHPDRPQYQFEITQPFAVKLFVESLRDCSGNTNVDISDHATACVLTVASEGGEELRVPLDAKAGVPQAVRWIGMPSRLPSEDLNELVSMVLGIRGMQSRPSMRSDRQLSTPFTDDEVRFFCKRSRYDMALAIYAEVRRIYGAKQPPLSDLDRGQWAHWVDEQRLALQDVERHAEAAKCCEEYIRIHAGDRRAWIMRDTAVNAEWRAKWSMYPLAGRLYARAGEFDKATEAFRQGLLLAEADDVGKMSARERAEVKAVCLFQCPLGRADALRRSGAEVEALATYRRLAADWQDGAPLRTEVLSGMPSKMADNFRDELNEALSSAIPRAIAECESRTNPADAGKAM